MRATEVNLHAAELLESTACVLATFDWWTTHADARNADHDSVEISDSSAVCFCTVGGVFAASKQLRNGGQRVRDRALQALETEMRNDVTGTNDGATSFRRDLLPAYTRAIDKLRGVAA